MTKLKNNIILRPNNKNKTELIRSLILCEGQTEVWYLTEVLDHRKVKIEKPPRPQALEIVNISNTERYNEYKTKYCTFDRDNNTKHDLEKINKIIKNAGRVLKRIHSNPCFEVMFWFGFYKNAPPIKTNDIESCINKAIAKKNIKNPYTYDKKEHIIKKLLQDTDFKTICTNAQNIYEKLEIDNNNWHTINDCYTEIFELQQFIK